METPSPIERAWMKATKFFLMALTLTATCSTHAANKCIGEDGNISFQDAPCPAASKSKEVITLRPGGNTVSGASTYGVGSLDISGTPSQRASKIQAALEALASVSTDCRIKLDVYGPSEQALTVCDSFTKHYKAWWAPSIEGLKKLTENTDWAKENIDSIVKSTDSMAKVNTNAEYVLRRLQTQRKSQ